MAISLWRLHRQAHGIGLDGMGGLYAGGRWHRQGTRVVYFGASAAIVVLEKLAHIDPAVLPSDLMLTRLEASVRPASVRTAKIESLRDINHTQAQGEAFIKERKGCLFRVPSVMLPKYEFNVVMNPLHPDAAKIFAVDSQPFRFDPRLL